MADDEKSIKELFNDFIEAMKNLSKEEKDALAEAIKEAEKQDRKK